MFPGILTQDSQSLLQPLGLVAVGVGDDVAGVVVVGASVGSGKTSLVGASVGGLGSSKISMSAQFQNFSGAPPTTFEASLPPQVPWLSEPIHPICQSGPVL